MMLIDDSICDCKLVNRERLADEARGARRRVTPPPGCFLWKFSAAAADKIELRVDNTPSGLRQLHDCINLKEIRFGAFSFSVSFLKISCPYLVTSYLKFEMFFTIFSNSELQ